MMDEIRCKKCGLWLERPDSICPRCIAIDGSEEEKRKFYENMDEHSIENAHISSIKKVAETLLRDGQHYTIDPREIINLINMLEYARATRIPPDSGAIRELGTRLVDLLDEDDWNNLEPFLLKAKGAQIELEKRLAEIEGQEKEVRGEPATVTDSDGCPIEKAVLRREWKKFNAYFQAEEKRHKEIDEHITALRARAEQAEKDVTEARGMCDLYVDEFHRIIAIADNSEIKGLCERAVFGIKQRIPLIEQRDNLEAENAALREEAALHQKEWAILRAEVERLRAENAQLKCNFAPILHFARQEQEKRGEPSVVIDSEGIPIENAVLRRNYITLRTRAEQAEAALRELYTYPGVRALLAPKDSLGSIAQRVEDILK